jgi:hypothetical protein
MSFSIKTLHHVELQDFTLNGRVNPNPKICTSNTVLAVDEQKVS